MRAIGLFRLLMFIVCSWSIGIIWPVYTIAQDIRPNEEAKRLFKAGVNAFNATQYQKSLEYFKAATEQEPEFALAYGNWGSCLRILGRHKEAIEKFQKAVKLTGVIEENFKNSLYAANARQIFPWLLATYTQWSGSLIMIAHYEEGIDKAEKTEMLAKGKAFFSPSAADQLPADFYKDWGMALKKLGRTKEANEKLQKAQ